MRLLIDLLTPQFVGYSLEGILPDRLMYTITSRKEMPNKEFCEEIAKAADDLFELFMVEEARM